jgi:hypothetical protein
MHRKMACTPARMSLAKFLSDFVYMGLNGERQVGGRYHTAISFIEVSQQVGSMPHRHHQGMKLLPVIFEMGINKSALGYR